MQFTKLGFAYPYGLEGFEIDQECTLFTLNTFQATLISAILFCNMNARIGGVIRCQDGRDGQDAVGMDRTP